MTMSAAPVTAKIPRTCWTYTLLLLACLVLSVIAVAYPMYVIRPFRPQGPRELPIALLVMRIRAILTLASAVAGIAVVSAYWRAQHRKLRRVLAVAGAGFVCLLAALARVNVYELMFHPVDHPSFDPVAQSKLGANESVIAVRIGARARAYPIRSISYHHIVNDVLDKVAIVATY